MPMGLAIKRAWLVGAAIAVAFALGMEPSASDSPGIRFFNITTEVGMPHLEENLRYATTREQACLSDEQLFRRFPVMDHVALKDCILAPERRLADSATYRLVCSGGHGTAGTAAWRIGEHRIRGTLTVKLGGKNMTFYQRVTALALGACAAGGDESGLRQD